jgi:hypothetical protein
VTSNSMASYTVITDSTHDIEMTESTASSNQLTITQEGWYLPTGI